MLIGAHVSTAGGLANAVGRGVERESDAIQIFNQTPRAWRPTPYTEEDCAAFREAVEPTRIQATAIHAVYLINCASPDPEIRRKSLASLTHALRLGDGIGAIGVVIHAGSRKRDPLEAALPRAGELIREALADSERCPILLENTAGTQGPLGRDFDELAALLEASGGDGRLGVCIDCCHLLASGYEIRSIDSMTEVVDELDAKVGLDRVRCLHLNDSAVPLGANRDQHENLGEGELGKAGLRPFLSEPRFDGLPALIETPGFDQKGPDLRNVRVAKSLRREGIANRRKRKARSRART